MSHEEDRKARVQSLVRDLRVTDLTCARTLRTPSGDVTVSVTLGKDERFGLQDAMLSVHLLGLQVDLACLDQAVACGLMGAEAAETQRMDVRRKYSLLILNEVDHDR